MKRMEEDQLMKKNSRIQCERCEVERKTTNGWNLKRALNE